MPRSTAQRAAHYAYYHRRALELLRQLEASHPQPADLAQIIYVATCLSRACPFSILNRFYQTIIEQANAALNERTAAQCESSVPEWPR